MITPFLIAGAGYFILGFNLSLFTIMFFLLNSFARGINTAKVNPFIQDVAPDDLQASALSMYNLFYRLMVALAMVSVNFFANTRLENGLLFAGIVCVLMWIIFKIYKPRWSSD